MENNSIYTTFFNQVKECIANGTFAKLTLAKTVGNPELQNIYVRTIVVEDKLKLSLTFKIYKDGLEEIVKECEIEEMQTELVPFMNNPFLTALLFTTERDVTVRLNKRREAILSEKEPTFKHASADLLEFLGM
jgi:hypothetical protein